VGYPRLSCRKLCPRIISHKRDAETARNLLPLVLSMPLSCRATAARNAKHHAPIMQHVGSGCPDLPQRPVPVDVPGFHVRIPEAAGVPPDVARGWETPCRKRWKVPQAVIDAFERHGFLWGSTWLFFETMHFDNSTLSIQLGKDLDLSAQAKTVLWDLSLAVVVASRARKQSAVRSPVAPASRGMLSRVPPCLEERPQSEPFA
jgi:hypothetical protein